MNKQLIEILDFATWLTFLVQFAEEVDIAKPGLVAVEVVVVDVVDIAIVVVDIMVVQLLLVVAKATSCRIDLYVLLG